MNVFKLIQKSTRCAPEVRAIGWLFCLVATLAQAGGQSNVSVDLGEYKDGGAATVTEEGGVLQAVWNASESEKGWVKINLRPDQPLIHSLGISRDGASSQPIARDLKPLLSVTVGERDAEKAGRGWVFFDNPRHRPYQTHLAKLEKKSVRVSSQGSRLSIQVDEVSFGSFRGYLEMTIYNGSPLLHVSSVVTTDEEFRAIVYDAGVISKRPAWEKTVWMEPHGRIFTSKVEASKAAWPVQVKHRVIVAEGESGSLAVFPHPHQYFYPLDFANNYEFSWFGAGYAGAAGYGLGIRQPLEGDNRWVPWVDAPPGTKQRLSLFYLLSSKEGPETIEEVAQYTREDKFKKLPGRLTFSSHYHVEHTDEFLRKQRDQRTDQVPVGLESPGFVTKFKETGVDIVHLAEFHFGHTPRQRAKDRLPMLKAMHDECRRLSDDEFLLLPGEEPNVHLGGHWISFFPKPVYWVLNRDGDQPFEQQIEGYGKVYHVGSPDDVLRLMQLENGLMWTAHARIKSSLGFPDKYKDRDFYKSDHFLGAAWKAMPSDLARPTLGWRGLELLDDMNNWGQKKKILGEVDVFRVELDYELYAHMNINYIKMDKLPKYDDGWQPVLDVLRKGEFFVTTGEVLIPNFTVGGKESGETLSARASAEMTVDLEWTFPMSYAEVVMGDGEKTYRKRIDLSQTRSFGTDSLIIPVDLRGMRWVRFEAWDVAANGAFTQPVWIQQ